MSVRVQSFLQSLSGKVEEMTKATKTSQDNINQDLGEVWQVLRDW